MKNLLWLAVFLPFFTFAQSGVKVPKTEWIEANGLSLYPSYTFPATDNLQADVEAYLLKAIPAFAEKADAGIKLQTSYKSALGYHFEFVQTYKGTEIFGTDIKINISPKLKVTSVFHKTVSTEYFTADAKLPAPDKAAIETAVGIYPRMKYRNVWFYDMGENIGAIRVEYATKDASVHEVALLDRNYRILYRSDRTLNAGPVKLGKDTIITGYVFRPDPLTSAQVPYGAPYIDNNDSAVPELDAQRVARKMHASFLDNKFYLEDSFVRVTDDESTPFYDGEIYTTSPVWNFSRADNNFEAINAWYHLHAYQQHLADLGFPDLYKRFITVDPHSLDGADNSMFTNYEGDTGEVIFNLLFGEGGIDDAEDADVIIHEYTHFIGYCANNGDNVWGQERGAVEEGSCDYMAASYSKAISTYNWQKVYNWDGNAKFQGRTCASAKTYPGDLKSDKYLDGEIWSSSLMAISDAIGRDKTDQLLFAAMHSFAKYIKMTDAALLVVNADSALNDGANVNDIARQFIKYGLLPASFLGIDEQAAQQADFKIVTQYFPVSNTVYFSFDKPQSGLINLYDVQGRLILSQRLEAQTGATITAPAIADGIYILRTQLNGLQRSFKILK